MLWNKKYVARTTWGSRKRSQTNSNNFDSGLWQRLCVTEVSEQNKMSNARLTKDQPGGVDWPTGGWVNVFLSHLLGINSFSPQKDTAKVSKIVIVKPGLNRPFYSKTSMLVVYQYMATQLSWFKLNYNHLDIGEQPSNFRQKVENIGSRRTCCLQNKWPPFFEKRGFTLTSIFTQF